MPGAALLLLSACAAVSCTRSARTELPRIVHNDNRRPAGAMHGDTLMLTLVARMAEWRPESDSGPKAVLAALGEEGGAPSIPAPLIRVREGALIRVTLHNALPDSLLKFLGLGTRPQTVRDTLRIKPGETREITFAAGRPGTYFYRAILGAHDDDKDDEREQLAGAFIVDPTQGSPTDRVLVINIWGTTRDSTTYPNALAINGGSWPYTERLEATVGDTVRWRVINASQRQHPMHLHGFYFTVRARGDEFADTLLTTENALTVVTHKMRALSTMDVSWTPDRPGNWLFHCHLGFHVIPEGARLEPAVANTHEALSADVSRHMAGLVLGIVVAPRAGSRPAARGAARRLDLFVNEGVRRNRAPRSLGFVLQRGPNAPATDSVEQVGSPLLLTRDEAMDITVHNRLKEPTAVHGHGIELESYSDGVVGWSGAAGRVTPLVAPSDSFVAHLTLPRAGTFIYHTHLGDLEQLTSGLYGAIVVSPPGKPFDARYDHLFVVGSDGSNEPPFVVVNGTRQAPPLELDGSRPHRFRLVGIGVAGGGEFSLRRGSVLVQWRALAKDGADLLPMRAVQQTANVKLSAGETYDFEFRPAPGEYMFTVVMAAMRPAWHQRIIVK